MNIKKNIARVFSANFLQLITSIIVGFYVPAVLSIEGYAILRTYTLYITYVGFTHLGFIDGMYIKYGGKDPDKIEAGTLKAEHRVFWVQQLMIMTVALGIGLALKELLWIFLGLSILPINAYSFHRMFYQATGQFKLYTKYAYIYTGCYFAFNALLAILLKTDNQWLYCLANLGSNVVVFLLLEIKFRRKMHYVAARYNQKELWNHVKIGVYILIGNLAVNMFYSIDQWFVKGALTDVDFAFYAFSVSLLSLVNVLINAISVTFYNFLAQGIEEQKVSGIKTLLVLLGSVGSGAFFALSAIVNVLLPKYIPSLKIVAISFAAIPYMMVINALYVNLYKVEKNEKLYLSEVVRMLFVAIGLNALALLFKGGVQGIAMATTVSFVLWFLYASRHFSYLKVTKKEGVYLIISGILFLVSSHYLHWFVGGVIYCAGIGLVGICLYKNQLKEWTKQIFNQKRGD